MDNPERTAGGAHTGKMHVTPADIARQDRIGSLLSFRRDHVAFGEYTDLELAALIRSREFVRVLRGAYMRTAQWTTLFPEERLLARSLAANRLTPDNQWVLSHHSAAALWGLPMFGLRDTRVHVVSSPARPGKSTRVVRHSHLQLAAGEIITIGEARATSLERTLVDLAHDAPAEIAIGAIDAGARRLLNLKRAGDRLAVQAWRTARLGPLEQSRRAGVRRARTIMGIADPRADSPAESVSRLQLHRLGVEYEIQVPVRLRGRTTAWMDFEFRGQEAFGEVDGVSKYTSAQLRGSRTAEEVVLEEKLREDEVRGTTGKRVVRWSPRDIAQARVLGARLQRFGLHVPGLARWAV